ncbi:MAG: heavy metal translocating P-type ATPase [Clostridia bacterium]|nr:heavy metal translocating P-type ATPase [Clostridia bacterium]
MKKFFDVQGMSCSACVAAVEKAVNSVDGVQNTTVSLLLNSMTVEGDFSAEKVLNAVEKAGYKAVEKGKEISKEQKDNSQDIAVKEKVNKLIASFALLIPIMVLGMTNMFADKLSLPTFLTDVFFGQKGAFNLAFTEMLLCSVVLLLNNGYFTRGFKALWHKNPNMDSLVAVGSLSAYLYGIVVIFQIVNCYVSGNLQGAYHLSHTLYFEGAAMILTLITLGKTLESKSKKKATDEISKIVALSPKTALVKKGDEVVETAVEDVEVGEEYFLREGDVVAIDGVILDGEISLNESNVNGESIPKDKTVHDKVLSGCVVVSGYAVVKTIKRSEDSAIQRIAKLVQEASSSKAPVQKLADKVAGVFVPVVFGIAIITFLTWMIISKDFQTAFNYAISVLVISCPCALGLATPVAIMVGTGVSAKAGLLIKSGDSLQNLSNVKVAVFDKTGTITKGKPEIVDVISYGLTEREILSVACSLESKSSHSLAKAFEDRRQKDNLTLLEVQDFTSKTAFGLSGVIDGREYKIGKAEFVGEISSKASKDFDDLAKMGKTCVYLWSEGEVQGIIAIFDSAKEGAKEGISKLTEMGVESVLLTGDKKETANYLANQVGIKRVIAEVLPEDKKNHVQLLKEEGLVAFIGDGVNDALAIKEADIGIAMSDGSEIAVDTSDVVIVGGKVEQVAKGVAISKKVLKKIKGNLFWAFFYNALCIPLAAGAFSWAGITLNPMIASIAMSFSSLFVVLNSLTINKKEKIKIMKKEMYIEGMMCMHCVKRAEDALNALEGVQAKVDLASKTAYLEVAENVSDTALKNAVEKQGYQVISIK